MHVLLNGNGRCAILDVVGIDTNVPYVSLNGYRAKVGEGVIRFTVDGNLSVYAYIPGYFTSSITEDHGTKVYKVLNIAYTDDADSLRELIEVSNKTESSAIDKAIGAMSGNVID